MKKYTEAVHFFAGLVMLGFGAAVHGADIGTPVTLVATDRLAGTPYAETVLFVVPAGDGQHMGLIVNRPTDLQLTVVLPDAARSQSGMAQVFFGGPVMSGALFAAVRAAEPPSNYSVPLMSGLFLVTDSDTVDRLIKAPPSEVRYFTGFVVGGPSELSSEVRSGMWDIQAADPSVFFRTNPQQLWLELARIKRHLVFK